MFDRFAILTFDDEKDSSAVEFSGRYHGLEPIDKLDFIRDSINLLADEYRRLLLVEHPNRRIDASRGIPVQDFLIAPIIS